MATIAEFFGYRAADNSPAAVTAAENKECPFLGRTCQKTLSDGTISGVCTMKPEKSRPVICCPIRLYAEDYKLLSHVSSIAFGEGFDLHPSRKAKAAARDSGKHTVAVFGKDWGGELRLPKRGGVGNYYVDWILALLDGDGELVEFVAIEVQSIDTTGNYRQSRTALLEDGRSIVNSTSGLNWENVNKRILPQLIYKGQVLQRESLCKKGLFFVTPHPVYEKVMQRLDGREKLPEYSYQPASITFLSYDIDSEEMQEGAPTPLRVENTHSTTVYKVQEAFGNVQLPTADVYRGAINDVLESDYVWNVLPVSGDDLGDKS